MRSTAQLSETKLDASTLTPNVLSANLGKRWRAERNFWISFITFTLWWWVSLYSLIEFSQQAALPLSYAQYLREDVFGTVPHVDCMLCHISCIDLPCMTCVLWEALWDLIVVVWSSPAWGIGY